MIIFFFVYRVNYLWYSDILDYSKKHSELSTWDFIFKKIKELLENNGKIHPKGGKSVALWFYPQSQQWASLAQKQWFRCTLWSTSGEVSEHRVLQRMTKDDLLQNLGDQIKDARMFYFGCLLTNHSKKNKAHLLHVSKNTYGLVIYFCQWGFQNYLAAIHRL